MTPQLNFDSVIVEAAGGRLFLNVFLPANGLREAPVLNLRAAVFENRHRMRHAPRGRGENLACQLPRLV